MQETNFSGLGMPVFTAFGWAGEETAIEYALSELEAFIHALHASLPRPIQNMFPVHGLNRDSRTVYLAASEDVESDIQIVFLARPMSMEMQFALQDEKLLNKAWPNASRDTVISHRLFTELGPDWLLRVQQLQVDEDSGEAANYGDLFMGSVGTLDMKTAISLFEKASYLNNDEKWIIPVYLSHDFKSEQIALMKTAVLDVIGKEISNLIPLITMLTGRSAKTGKAKAAPKRKKKTSTKAEAETEAADENSFTYTATLKPLHLRRGFINLTPEHWDFFTINSRTVTRDVTIYYDGIYDKASTAWKLSTNGQTRIVLSPAVCLWLNDNFEDGDKIEVMAHDMGEGEIQLTLSDA